jgi:filamentous hemagglutinin
MSTNGNASFTEATLNISVGSAEHAKYFSSLRPNSTVISFDVPKWFDDMLKEYAIPQQGYNANPLNMKGLAPKIVDPHTPGLSYELPPVWSKWLRQNYVRGSAKVN